MLKDVPSPQSFSENARPSWLTAASSTFCGLSGESCLFINFCRMVTGNFCNVRTQQGGCLEGFQLPAHVPAPKIILKKETEMAENKGQP